ncbi:hypothetical protein D3C72_1286030 [compost metagenome]
MYRQCGKNQAQQPQARCSAPTFQARGHGLAPTGSPVPSALYPHEHHTREQWQHHEVRTGPQQALYLNLLQVSQHGRVGSVRPYIDAHTRNHYQQQAEMAPCQWAFFQKVGNHQHAAYKNQDRVAQDVRHRNAGHDQKKRPASLAVQPQPGADHAQEYQHLPPLLGARLHQRSPKITRQCQPCQNDARARQRQLAIAPQQQKHGNKHSANTHHGYGVGMAELQLFGERANRVDECRAGDGPVHACIQLVRNGDPVDLIVVADGVAARASQYPGQQCKYQSSGAAAIPALVVA